MIDYSRKLKWILERSYSNVHVPIVTYCTILETFSTVGNEAFTLFCVVSPTTFLIIKEALSLSIQPSQGHHHVTPYLSSLYSGPGIKRLLATEETLVKV